MSDVDTDDEGLPEKEADVDSEADLEGVVVADTDAKALVEADAVALDETLAEALDEAEADEDAELDELDETLEIDDGAIVSGANCRLSSFDLVPAALFSSAALANANMIKRWNKDFANFIVVWKVEAYCFCVW